MPVETNVLPASDFQSLPLDFIIAAPLVAAVNAQRTAAETTKSFIESFLNPVSDSGKPTGAFEPKTANFNLKVQETDANGKGQTRNVQLNVPLLSLTPVPHLRIDSLTTHFKYEVSQIVGQKKDETKQGEASGAVKYLPFFEASLKGSLSSSSSEQSTTNRSGMLEITVHASEAPIPEGLARLLSVLAKMAEPVALAPAAPSGTQ